MTNIENIKIENGRELVKASPAQIDKAIEEICEMTAIAADVNDELAYLEEALERLERQKRLYTMKAKSVRSKLIKMSELLR